MEEFRETELNGVKLRVYRDGTIWRYFNKGNNIYQLGWNKLILHMDKHGYYVSRLNNGKIYKCHRIIAMVYLGLDITDIKRQVDHIDRCKTNNNVNNLQLVTNGENQFNRNAKGCFLNKRDNKWTAYISVNKKRKHLGNFDNEEDARNAYLEAKTKYHVINQTHNLHP
jgi:hypothetical protein